MNKDNSGLLIAALVAIVAVVGLVILFKGGAEGAQVINVGPEPSYRQGYAIEAPEVYKAGQLLGKQIAVTCDTQRKDRGECCSRECGDDCGPQDVCWRACINECKEAVHNALASRGLR